MPFITASEEAVIVCGISTGFPVLFPTPRQITHVVLTRAPLYSGTEVPFLARLACVRHAASVDSEPGSNSQNNFLKVDTKKQLLQLKDSVKSTIRHAFRCQRAKALKPQTVLKNLETRRHSKPLSGAKKARLILLGGFLSPPRAR